MADDYAKAFRNLREFLARERREEIISAADLVERTPPDQMQISQRETLNGYLRRIAETQLQIDAVDDAMREERNAR